MLEAGHVQRTPRRLPAQPDGSLVQDGIPGRRTLRRPRQRIAPCAHRLFVRSALRFWRSSFLDTVDHRATCTPREQQQPDSTRADALHCGTSHHGQQPGGLAAAARSVRPRRRHSCSPETTLCLQLREAPRQLAPSAGGRGGRAGHRQRLLRAEEDSSPPEVRSFGGGCRLWCGSVVAGSRS